MWWINYNEGGIEKPQNWLNTRGGAYAYITYIVIYESRGIIWKSMSTGV